MFMQLKKSLPRNVEGEYVEQAGEIFYRIRNFDRMEPFFLSIVSNSDHWLFVSSSGGVTAGRKDSNGALFPYYTDDRIADSSGISGPVSILRVLPRTDDSEIAFIWEPFYCMDWIDPSIERNLYKNLRGNCLIFEEINKELGLSFRYSWRTSDAFGFVKHVELRELSGRSVSVEILDGLLNLLPSGTDAGTQLALSNLLDAYKRGECDPDTGLGIFSYGSLLTDLPEPREALRASVAWVSGLDTPQTLLSTRQLADFRRGLKVEAEPEMRGFRCAYLVNTTLSLPPNGKTAWDIVADTGLDTAAVADLRRKILGSRGIMDLELEQDIAKGSREIDAIVAAVDGLQASGDEFVSAHHYANVLFNAMRGGVFAKGYVLDKKDILEFFAARNREVLRSEAKFFASLPDTMRQETLIDRAVATGSSSLERIAREYLPLMFGRRHGDPSRPWNHFSINVRNNDGSLRLDYQGNWRDIFQNWESLAWSYPGYLENMICSFLNATTYDGYNPYRIMRSGIEWEVPDENNPWANIGYWSDHQIIYLEKLLELSARFHPGTLESLLGRRIFSYAAVPYRIKDYEELQRDFFHTIVFDVKAHEALLRETERIGGDGKLLKDESGQIALATLAEKLFSLLCAKFGNFVPEGGIWMNTQRPEWNDANNVLAGKGLSVVTSAYLYRFVSFIRRIFAGAGLAEHLFSSELAFQLTAMLKVLRGYAMHIETGFDDRSRRSFLDAMGGITSNLRRRYYHEGVCGTRESVGNDDILEFLDLANRYLEQSLGANRRSDGLFHAYNIIRFGESTLSFTRLDEMLEGQVAVLSSGFLKPAEALDLYRSLRMSRLYRQDQQSYILHPNKSLSGFLARNTLPPSAKSASPLLEFLISKSDWRILVQDAAGELHFAGNLRSVRDLDAALASAGREYGIQNLVESEAPRVREMYERHFDHSSFIGRSGSFFAYEGLGSIYWHMVSKLLLAVQECCVAAYDTNSTADIKEALASAYHEIRNGLGFKKSPSEYGAFPADPYSHTPAGAGAKQPGMTGSVKEEILSRFGELGIRVESGRIGFFPTLLRQTEYLQDPAKLDYFDIDGETVSLELPPGTLAFTLCQVPIVFRQTDEEYLQILYRSGNTARHEGRWLDFGSSQAIFRRDGKIKRIELGIKTLE